MKLVKLTDIPTYITLKPTELSGEEHERFRRLCSWSYDAKRGRVGVVRKAPHLVGRIVIRDFVFSVVPNLAPRTFVDFMLYASGLDPKRFLTREAARVAGRTGHDHDEFLRLLAHLMLSLTDNLAAGFIARSYERRRGVLQTVRGRPHWPSNFGRHPHTGLVCDYYVIEQDNLANQLILAGLEAARVILGPESDTRLNRLLFAWRSICSSILPTQLDFERAEKKLNRLTAAYRPALAVARTLLFGFTALDIFNFGKADLQCMQFDVSAIFERFLARLLRERFAETGCEVIVQADDGRALLDRSGMTYRFVRPDILVVRDGVPIAVLDAKYKPRYAADPPARLSPEDIYQMFFYATRALYKGAAPSTLAVAVIVPADVEGQQLSRAEELGVFWAKHQENQMEIKVIPIQIRRIIDGISAGETGVAAIEHSNDFAKLCRQIARAGLAGRTEVPAGRGRAA